MEFNIKIIYKFFLYSIAIILLFFFNIKYQSYHKKIDEKKILLSYQEMYDSYKKKDFISVIYHADNIYYNYNYSVYSSISRLFCAKYAFIKNKYKSTRYYLECIKYNRSKAIMQNIVNKRLIKIYIIKKKWKKALILLSFYKNKKKSSLYEEMTGDIYMHVREYKRAKISYIKAKKYENRKKKNTFLDLKIKYLSNI